jgi:phosphatidylserine decarboxylase
MLNPQVPVAREGYPFVGFAALCAVSSACLGFTWLTLLLLTATAFILYFFRDPERFTPEDPHLLVSPADGRVIMVDKVEDHLFTGAEAWKVSIFMNVFNVHVNRIPFSGRVTKILYKPGRFYSADSVKGGLENEYCAAIIQTDQEKSIAVVQVAGLIARRIVCWLENGDDVTTGKRFGLIRFGSRVDLYLPAETAIMVNNGDRVRAGETPIGHLN